MKKQKNGSHHIYSLEKMLTAVWTDSNIYMDI